MESSARISYLLNGHIAGSLSDREKESLLQMLDNPEALQQWNGQLARLYEREAAGAENYRQEEVEKMVRFILKHTDEQEVSLNTAADVIRPVHRVHFLRTAWFRYAAAAILIIAGIGTYTYFLNNHKEKPIAVINPATFTNEVLPGKEGAVLTLADGTQVVLDSLGNGLVAAQKGAKVLLQNGQLAYDPTDETAGETMYNTMTTPKGRQFQLILPDGTKVWLNAASSIRYPTVFSGKERSVEINGEAYFEVVQNARQPFSVKIDDRAEVQVLGTSFNINAYDNESTIATTLVEGKVRVSLLKNISFSGQNDVVLTPGQQAQIMNQTLNIKNSTFNITQALAWKNGLFNFEDATLEEIMRQLERWYDIEVVYTQHAPNIELMGKLTRGVTMNELLPALRKMGVQCRLEGRKLTVMP